MDAFEQFGQGVIQGLVDPTNYVFLAAGLIAGSLLKWVIFPVIKYTTLKLACIRLPNFNWKWQTNMEKLEKYVKSIRKADKGEFKFEVDGNKLVLINGEHMYTREVSAGIRSEKQLISLAKEMIRTSARMQSIAAI